MFAEGLKVGEYGAFCSGSLGSALAWSESTFSDRGLAEASGLKNSQASWSRLSATTMAFRSDIVGVVLFLIEGLDPSIFSKESQESSGKSDMF